MLHRLRTAAGLHWRLSNAEEREMTVKRKLRSAQDKLTLKYRDDLERDDQQVRREGIEPYEVGADQQQIVAKQLVAAVVEDHPAIKLLKQQLVQAQQRVAEAKRAHAQNRAPREIRT